MITEQISQANKYGSALSCCPFETTACREKFPILGENLGGESCTGVVILFIDEREEVIDELLEFGRYWSRWPQRRVGSVTHVE